MSTPEFVSVGYIIRDTLWGEVQAGGSSLYASMTAQRFGLRSGIITNAEIDFPHSSLTGSIQIFRQNSSQTTEFVHFYGRDVGVPQQRVSYCLQRAEPVQCSSPLPWKKSRIVYLSPNWTEVTPELISWFDSDNIGLFPQGWFRQSDSSGLISFGRSPWNQIPKKVKLIVVSEEDICNDSSAWDWIQQFAEVAICTRGKNGYTLSLEGKEQSFRPPYVAEEVDPTGAGDVFGAATLIGLSEGWSPENAAHVGSLAASFAVEKIGLDGIPTRGMVFSRMKELHLDKSWLNPSMEKMKDLR